MAGRVVTGLRDALAGYLDLRRGLGFKLERRIHVPLGGRQCARPGTMT